MPLGSGGSAHKYDNQIQDDMAHSGKTHILFSVNKLLLLLQSCQLYSMVSLAWR
ncbi:hypothetical protein RNAN_2497 [Rheinheimera nanhaiensis E407-8]|uniref:Uncharacterized protein n=1 Tax=Rheinheimera nanhaiensis E407-8 TaxID=562729 RepID=I1DZL3_9GAMM|nr:hypothetical protein RNAN_2497 [Rheinheimera nanhaiensis E407-8]